jgi:hypothetical protein
MSDSQKSFRIEIRIDRKSARRALVVGGTLLVLAAVGVATAVPVTFNDGDTLTAATMNQNFTNLEGRVAALEMARARETHNGRVSSGAVYCGSTATTRGDLSGLTAAGKGYAKAKAACEAVNGCSSTAHPCSADELFRTMELAIVPPTIGWAMVESGVSGGVDNACEGFTNTTIATDRGTVWVKGGADPNGYYLGDSDCGQSLPLLCCD